MAEIAVHAGLNLGQDVARGGEPQRQDGQIGLHIALGQTADADGAVADAGVDHPLSDQGAAADQSGGDQASEDAERGSVFHWPWERSSGAEDAPTLAAVNRRTPVRRKTGRRRPRRGPAAGRPRRGACVPAARRSASSARPATGRAAAATWSSTAQNAGSSATEVAWPDRETERFFSISRGGPAGRDPRCGYAMRPVARWRRSRPARSRPARTPAAGRAISSDATT